MSSDGIDGYGGPPPAEDEEIPPGALARTAQPLPLEVHEVEADPIPEGMICIGTFIAGKMVARCVLPIGALEQFAKHGFFESPRQLVLAARETDPGLRCELYAIVPLPRPLREEAADPESSEPWLEAANAQGYERSLADDADAEEVPEAVDESEDSMQAAVLLGQIVRFQRDRVHPESLILETADVLSRIVQGDVVSVVDKVLEDLLGPDPL